MKTNNSRFQKGSGCYTCRICNKQTRAGANGDPSAVALKLCVRCYEIAGDENAILDGQLTVDDFRKKWNQEPDV